MCICMLFSCWFIFTLLVLGHFDIFYGTTTMGHIFPHLTFQWLWKKKLIVKVWNKSMKKGMGISFMAMFIALAIIKGNCWRHYICNSFHTIFLIWTRVNLDELNSNKFFYHKWYHIYFVARNAGFVNDTCLW